MISRFKVRLFPFYEECVLTMNYLSQQVCGNICPTPPNLMVFSLERIDAYLHIEQEKKSTNDGIPPAYWPASGDIKVEKLAARYSLDGPRVLEDVSFHVKSGERIGVGKLNPGRPSPSIC